MRHLWLAAWAGLTMAASGALAQPAPPRPAPGPPPGPAAPEKPTVLRLDSVVPLRGAGGIWGQPVVDEAGRRLYLPRGVVGLSVLALDGLKPAGDVAETIGSVAVALDPETQRGYSANGLSASPGGVTVFDMRSLKPVGRIDVATPVLVAFDNATRQVAVVDAEGLLSLVDPAKLTVTTTIQLDGKRAAALATDRRGRLFVTLADRDSIAVIDLVSRKLAATWSVLPCRAPSPMHFDGGTFRLMVGCRGAAGTPGGPPAGPPMGVLLDPYSGKGLASFNVPGSPDAVMFDAQAKVLVFSSGQAGAVVSYKQIDFNRYEALETSSTRPLAGLGAVDSRTGRVILTSAEFVNIAARTPTAPPGAGLVPGLAPAPGPGAASPPQAGVRILANSFALLVLRRLALD